MAQDNRNDRKDDTEKLRAEAAALLEQARNQLADIQRALSSLGGDRAAHGRLAAAADRLSAIVSELSQAVNSRAFPLRGADLAAIGGAVQSSEAHAAIVQAAASPTETSASAAANVATASAETRAETESLARDVFDRHIFDPYLHYASAEDEAESRKRQAADKKYIADQLARHTPEGDLNAGGGMIDSMLDLHAHGAGNSAQFAPKWNALTEKVQREHDAMRAAGRSTAEYDHRVDASVRRYLKGKNLSDAEIETRMKASANPLDAVKSFMKDDRDSRILERQIRPAAHMDHAASVPLARVETADANTPANSSPAIDLDAISAKLKAAGLKFSDHAEAEPTHGLNVQKVAAKNGAALGG